MKLYNVPNNTTVIIKDEKVIIPPWSLEIKKGDVLKLYLTDDMYGHCINKDGMVVYPAAWTEVEIVEEK